MIFTRIRTVGLLFLALVAAVVAGCRATPGGDPEATIRAAVEGTVGTLQRTPQPAPQVGVPPGPPTAPAQPQGEGAAQIEYIAAGELWEMVQAGEAVIIDARAARSYAQRHISGAISMPHSEVATRYPELPADKEIVFYCT